MRLPPKKPHFFKPILPGFKNGVSIPPNFFRFLNGTKHEKAILKRGGREWHVKINHGKLGDDGWKRFSEDNDFQVGDFAVFGHEGNMVFEVLRFDPTTCLNECSAPVIKVDPEETEEAEEETSAGSETKEAEEETSSRSSRYLQSKELKRGPKAAPVAETIPSKERPYFVSFIKPVNVKHSLLYVPKDFAKRNGLLKEYCKITLVDDLQRSWPVILRYNNSHVSIGSGWINFREANGLKVGDRFKFEIIKAGKTPVVNFILELKKGRKATPVAKTISCRERPYFVSIIKPCNVKYHRLGIPKDFANQNGLLKEYCKITLVDELQRLWPVVLRYNQTHVFIGSGWLNFREANGLRVGDCFKFEIIKTGKTPMVNFTLELKKGPKATPVAETISCRERPHFVSFIKPCNVKYDRLYLPKEFAKKNGLIKKCCKITLVDDLQRSWPVVLRHDQTHVSLSSGWIDFREANDLKAGDRFKFEIIKIGKAPVANFTLLGKDCRGRDDENVDMN